MRYISHLLNILFPSGCPSCGNISDNHIHNPICSSCWEKIKRYIGPSCSVCGLPTVSSHTKTCNACLQKRPPFSVIVYYGIYEGVLRDAIHLLKFKGIKRLAGPLSHLLWSVIADLNMSGIDMVVPVPMHKKRLLQREFNQTATIGLLIAKKLNRPLMDVLQKNRDTLPQTYVNGKERLNNMKSAFIVSGEIKGSNILLVDDVITTGATVLECAKVLMKAGAKSVTIAALARSMPRGNT